MTMTNHVAQVRITREVREAEDALNEALIRQSSLFTSILAVRRDIGLGAFEGHDALLRLTKSQQSLLAAGSDLARTHGRLAELGTEIFGTVGDTICPPQKGAMNDTPALRVAA